MSWVRSKALMTALGVFAPLMALVLTVAIAGTKPSPGIIDPAPRPGGPRAKPLGGNDGPCMVGSRIDLDSVPASYPLMMPDTSIANHGNVDAVWLCGEGLIVEFRSGVAVQMNPAEVRDPQRYFANTALMEPRLVTLGFVQGIPAMFIDPDGDGPRQAGGVEFFLDGFHVFVVGRGHASLAELKEMAESLRPVAR